MATLADFMPFIMPSVPGCSITLAELHLRRILIDFCSHAPIVQVAIDPISIVAGQNLYDIETPSGTDVSLILGMLLDGLPVPAFKTGDRYQNNGQAYLQSADNTFSLNITPPAAIADAITMLVSTKPSKSATVFADVLADDYAYEIGQGVIGRLLLMPGQPFTSPNTAFAHTNIYMSERTAARIMSEQSFGTASSRVRYRRFQ